MRQRGPAGRRQRWVAHEQHLLERIARGDAASGVLAELCDSAQHLMERDAQCAVHLLDAEAVRLAEVIAPSMTSTYFRAHQPVTIGATAGVSAAAAYLRRQIVCEEVRHDPLMSEWADAAANDGIAAVCATPVLSSAGTLVAVFSVYYSEPGRPSASDLQVLEWAARLSCIALAQDQTIEALRLSEQKYRSFLENLSDGVFVAQEGVIVYANPAVTAMTGRVRSQLLGSEFDAMIEAADAAMLLDYEQRRVSGERVPDEYEVRVTRSDGAVRDLRLRQTEIAWDGAPAVLATLSDITERKQAEREVRRLNAELERRVAERTRELAAVNRELEAFSYSVSHDLRAPVRTINGFSSMLLEDHGAALSAEARGHLERVHRAAQRMGEMIDGLLVLARVSRELPRFERVDLSALAHGVVKQLQEANPERTVECEIGAGLQAWGDRRLLQAALENLLANAWKFTGKVERARIEFGASGCGGTRAFHVRDNGAGFDMKYSSKLFGVFQRLHRSEEFEGTGIGLATVQRIMSCHGGRAWAESEPGRGATFYFTLPEDSPQERQQAPSAATSAS